jgi:hypothetical protein
MRFLFFADFGEEHRGRYEEGTEGYLRMRFFVRA